MSSEETLGFTRDTLSIYQSLIALNERIEANKKQITTILDKIKKIKTPKKKSQEDRDALLYEQKMEELKYELEICKQLFDKQKLELQHISALMSNPGRKNDESEKQKCLKSMNQVQKILSSPAVNNLSLNNTEELSFFSVFPSQTLEQEMPILRPNATPAQHRPNNSQSNSNFPNFNPGNRLNTNPNSELRFNHTMRNNPSEIFTPESVVNPPLASQSVYSPENRVNIPYIPFMDTEDLPNDLWNEFEDKINFHKQKNVFYNKISLFFQNALRTNNHRLYPTIFAAEELRYLYDPNITRKRQLIKDISINRCFCNDNFDINTEQLINQNFDHPFAQEHNNPYCLLQEYDNNHQIRLKLLKKLAYKDTFADLEYIKESAHKFSIKKNSEVLIQTQKTEENIQVTANLSPNSWKQALNLLVYQNKSLSKNSEDKSLELHGNASAEKLLYLYEVCLKEKVNLKLKQEHINSIMHSNEAKFKALIISKKKQWIRVNKIRRKHSKHKKSKQ